VKYRTSSISVANVSQRLNEMFADRNRDELAFWTLVQDYVGRILNGRVAQDVLPELTQDILIEAFKSLPRFKARKEHDGGYAESWNGNTSFTRWLSGICWRRGANIFRDLAQQKEVAISQIGTWTDDDTFEPAELSVLEMESDTIPYTERLDAINRTDRVSNTLDAVRARLSAKDRKLFDLLRRGMSHLNASRKCGIAKSSVHDRIVKWRQLAEDLKEVPRGQEATAA
jgi:DNA-directed RNA polymerase specialized sigma24 family protein